MVGEAKVNAAERRGYKASLKVEVRGMKVKTTVKYTPTITSMPMQQSYDTWLYGTGTECEKCRRWWEGRGRTDLLMNHRIQLRRTSLIC